MPGFVRRTRPDVLILRRGHGPSHAELGVGFVPRAECNRPNARVSTCVEGAAECRVSLSCPHDGRKENLTFRDIFALS